jgi:hypothetical protein
MTTIPRRRPAPDYDDDTPIPRRPQWHRTRQHEWIVMAPADAVTPGMTEIRVITARGDAELVEIRRVSRPFDTDRGPAVFITPGTIRTDPTSITVPEPVDHRCQDCGRIAPGGLFFTHDESGIGGWACGSCLGDLLAFA